MEARRIFMLLALLALGAGCAHDPRGQFWNLSRCWEREDAQAWCHVRERAQDVSRRLDL